jgi:hypothetical protein
MMRHPLVNDAALQLHCYFAEIPTSIFLCSFRMSTECTLVPEQLLARLIAAEIVLV